MAGCQPVLHQPLDVVLGALGPGAAVSLEVLRGRVVFPAAPPPSLSAQVLPDEVLKEATVSLISLDNQTVATGVTNEFGNFSFTPSPERHFDENVIFILEAAKGLSNHAVGKSQARMRTFVKWTKTGWQSLTGRDLIVNPATTSVTIAQHLFNYSMNNIFGTVANPTIDPATSAFQSGAGGIEQKQYDGILSRVTRVLEANSDPITHVRHDKVGNFLYSTIVTPPFIEGDISIMAGGAISQDGAMNQATVHYPYGLDFDDTGRYLYIGDLGNQTVRQVDLTSNQITTIGGTPRQYRTINGAYQEGAVGVATYYSPYDVAFVRYGAQRFVLVADYNNARVRKIDLNTLTTSTLVSRYVIGLAYDGQRYVYMSSYNYHQIWRYDMQTGQQAFLGGQTNMIGNETAAFTNGDRTVSQFYYPRNLTIDRGRNLLYIADQYNHAVRVMELNSTGQGGKWDPINSGLTNQNVRALAVNPALVKTVYAATPAGVFRSLSNGNGWAPLNTGLGNLDAYALAFAPNSTNLNATVYVGTDGGVFRRSDQRSSTGQFWQSSNWTAISTGLGDLSVRALAVDPAAPATVYAGTLGGVFKSTDSGDNWVASSNGLTSTSIRALVLQGTSLYAATDGGVFKSTDGSNNWIAVNTGLTSLDMQSVAVDAANPTTLYAGTRDAGVFKSIDGGTGWTARNNGLTTQDIRGLTSDTVSTPALVYAATDNGVFKSSDGANSWVPANMGLTSQDVRAVVPEPNAPTTITAVTGGGLFRSGNFRVSTVVGNGSAAYQDGTGTGARLYYPLSLAFDPITSLLFVGDNSNYVLRKVSLDAEGLVGTISHLSGVYNTNGYRDGAANASLYWGFGGLAVQGSNLYVSDASNHRIRRVDTNLGQSSTLLGGAHKDGTGLAARFALIRHITSDEEQFLYLTEARNHTIRKVNFETNEVTTLAGNGAAGFLDGTGAQAEFNSPWGIAYDGKSSLYVADNVNRRIRKVDVNTGATTTLSGDPNTVGTADGPISATSFDPRGLTFSKKENRLYILDGSRLRTFDPETGQVSTLMGGGGAYAGNLTNTRLFSPKGIALGNGKIYVTDGNHVREIDYKNNTVSVYAGSTSTAGFNDGNIAAALFDNPQQIASDGIGSLYVADYANWRVRKIELGTGQVVTLAGGGSGIPRLDSFGLSARLAQPSGVYYSGKYESLYVGQYNDADAGYMPNYTLDAGNYLRLLK